MLASERPPVAAADFPAVSFAVETVVESPERAPLASRPLQLIAANEIETATMVGKKLTARLTQTSHLEMLGPEFHRPAYRYEMGGRKAR